MFKVIKNDIMGGFDVVFVKVKAEAATYRIASQNDPPGGIIPIAWGIYEGTAKAIVHSLTFAWEEGQQFLFDSIPDLPSIYDVAEQ